VTIDDEAGEPEGPVARLTPLGSCAVREQLAEAGVEVPLLPPPAEMTAADLVAAAEGADEDEIAAETDAWLAQRAPDAAARELLEFAAQGSPVERLVAITAVQRIGAAAEPRWQDALTIRTVRSYAKIALTEIMAGSAAASRRRPCADADRQASPRQEGGQAGSQVRLQGEQPTGFGPLSARPRPSWPSAKARLRRASA
jgi:hypothetical protein